MYSVNLFSLILLETFNSSNQITTLQFNPPPKESRSEVRECGTVANSGLLYGNITNKYIHIPGGVSSLKLNKCVIKNKHALVEANTPSHQTSSHYVRSNGLRMGWPPDNFEQVQSSGRPSLSRKFVARPVSLYYVHEVCT